MGRRSKHFRKADEKFIAANFDCMTVSEIARKRGIPYSHIYNYMVRKGFPMLTERAKRKKCSKQEPAPSKFFNCDNKQNWIL